MISTLVLCLLNFSSIVLGAEVNDKILLSIYSSHISPKVGNIVDEEIKFYSIKDMKETTVPEIVLSSKGLSIKDKLYPMDALECRQISSSRLIWT